MRAKLILFIIIVGIVTGTRYPICASLLYSWITLFRPVEFTRGQVGSFVTISFGVLCVSIIIGTITKSLKPTWNVGTTCLILIMGACLFSCFFSPFQIAVWENLTTTLKIILPAILISLIISNEKHFKYMIYCFAACIGIWAVQAAVFGLVSARAISEMKIGGQMSDRNDFCLGVLMTWPFCYYLALNQQNKFLKIAGFGMAFMVALCIVVSNSRGAMIGLAGVLFLNYTRKGIKKLRNIIYMIFATIIIIPLLPQFVIDRMDTIELSTEQSEGSASSRMILMKAGFTAALDNPFAGVGVDCWANAAPDYVPGGSMGDGAYEPHSIWVKLAAELGFTGVLIYLSAIFWITISLKKITKDALDNGNVKFANYSNMMQLSLVGFCLAGTFSNQVYFEYFFLVIAVSGGFVKMYQLNREKSIFQNEK